jgi:hypothetical protein
MRIGVALVLLPGNGKSITSCCHSRWSAFTSGTVFSNLSSQEIQTRFALCTFALKGPRFKLISTPKHSGCKTCKTSVQSSSRGETVLSLLLAAGSCWPGFWVLNLVYLVYSKPKASLNQNWLAKWTMWTTRELFKPPFLRELSKLFAIQRPLPPGGSDFDCNPFPKLHH